MNTSIKENGISEEFFEKLLSIGLSKTQASSQAVGIVTNYLMNEDDKILIKEAERQVYEMRKIVNLLHEQYSDLVGHIKNISEDIKTLKDLQDEHGELTDERARNAILLYSFIIGKNKEIRADVDESVKSAGYILYAYLGGQAKREMTYFTNNEEE